MTSVDQMKHRLDAAAATLGLQLEEQQKQTLLHFVRQMERWNRTYNLTAIKNPQQMLVQHVFDSLAIVPSVQGALGSGAARIVDVGSGGGLPGVVLAICLPQTTVYCIDAVEKKVAFVRQMAAVLHLPNLQAIHSRIEQLDSLDASLIISRAFASLSDFVKLSERHTGAEGRFLAMKGRQPDDEISALEAETGWQVESVQSLDVPELAAERCLVWIGRKGNT